ncbi:PLP-dependent aminotransferase family protein [Hoeflea sp. YIM 152468]|uniref:MocR-like ectoine utilization transcription factor EhuR n=1 Tax=Hoeflea sp. YIM 152468 TaxID=3031759 RepID=UPI0023DC0A9D|nr:PLP-dependent aminotransferase family protein [Hoeflea sp. YIM 152468]MDF1609283.1 PLP-dependent aminotransferase family protein [Hoeflea sp. YIM 152468]
MTIWPPKPQDLRRPAYKSLAAALIRAVDAGELRNGDRLPTHRTLAYDLGLSVQTVSRAYDELIRRGFIAGEVGRGTFVRVGRSDTKTPFVPDSQNGEFIDFSLLMPVFENLHLAEMQRALARLATDMPASTVSAFRPSTALRKYNDAAANWLALCGLKPSSQGLLMTNGNTSAMTIALMTVASTGDLIVTEELGHHTLKALSRYLGLRIQGLEVDMEGIVPSAFAAACEKSQVKAVYLMPAGLNPRAVTMSVERRRELVALARRYDVLIIENDAWGPLQPGRPDPIAAMAPERTFYFTSMTKCIMPGLRFGYLTMPEAFESAAANRHLVTSWMATPLMAEIGSRWIDDGTAERLLNWQMQALGRRNELAAEVLAGIPFHSSSNGMHIWLPIPGSWTEDGFVAHARLNGVAVAPGSAFAMSETVAKHGVRICLGAETDQAFERGLTVISRLARSNPEPALLTL